MTCVALLQSTLRIGLYVGLVAAAPALAQQSADDEFDLRDLDADALRENVGRLLDGVDKLGSWDEHGSYIINAAERVYERNGWESEPHQFSLNVIRAVESLPPSAMQERFDTFVGMFSDRYLLDESQERTLRWSLMRESLRTFAKNAPRIMKYSIEMLETRAAGEAFTAEQVERWTRMARPVFHDSRGALQRVARDLIDTTDPQQRDLIQADLSAANQRLDRIEELTKKWMNGNWEAADWGLDQDPIQLAGEARLAERGAAPAASGDSGSNPSRRPGRKPTASPTRTGPKTAKSSATERPARRDAARSRAGATPPQRRGAAAEPKGPTDPWRQYVQAFIRTYELKEAQQQKAWRIFDQVNDRRTVYVRRYEKGVEQLEQRSADQQTALRRRLTEQRDDTLKRLFHQLKRRLLRLPTRAQRANAAGNSLLDLYPDDDQQAGKSTSDTVRKPKAANDE